MTGSVRPSFVANGPTSPVVLLADDVHFTQLAGIPAVAWQTPWSEISNLELVRVAHRMALFATVADVRYCWRNRELTDYEELPSWSSNTAASSRAGVAAWVCWPSSRSWCWRVVPGASRPGSTAVVRA
jgi:hypothetical protein